MTKREEELMKKYDPTSDLMSVEFALWDEMRQEKPNEAVIASCALFMAITTRPAKQQQALKDRKVKDVE